MEEFEQWWSEFPRKCAKADARKAWMQTVAARPPLATLIEATRRACRDPQWMRDGGRYIPYPATWLRGERWADEGVELEKIAPPKPTRAPWEPEWQAVRAAIQADDPRGLTDTRTRYAIAQIGWPVLTGMKTDQVMFMQREFARLFMSAPSAPRAQVHVLPVRRVA